jgi:ankyrin repeat protein
MSIYKKTIIILVVSAFFFMPCIAEEIHDAAREGNADKVKALLAKNPELVKAKDPRGMTPLHFASFRGHTELVKLLIKAGAVVDAGDQRGTTPLIGAAYFGHKEIAEVLIAGGADINRKFVDGRTPLLFTIFRGHKELTELLIAKGASLKVTDKLGSTPLLLAAMSGHKAIVELLLAKGEDIDAANSRGSTPLSAAAREGHKEIVELLTAKGADPSALKLPVLKGEYLGQKKPGLTPLMFAKGFVSTEKGQLNAVFTKDGKEFYYSQIPFTIMVTKRVNDRWTKPEVAPFSGKYSDVDHSISPDGKKLFYCSRRPITKDGEKKKDHDFWVVERTAAGWSEPRHLGTDVNTDKEDYYPTVTKDGTLYFSSQREGEGTNNIYRSLLKDGKYGKAEKLGEAVNTKHREFDPLIAPDESYLIFASERPGGFGASDLYISFRKKDGSWTQAKNMGEKVNSDSSDYTPMLSPDGKYLFFTSGRAGVTDIYWIDAKVIESAKK